MTDGWVTRIWSAVLHLTLDDARGRANGLGPQARAKVQREALLLLTAPDGGWRAARERLALMAGIPATCLVQAGHAIGQGLGLASEPDGRKTQPERNTPMTSRERAAAQWQRIKADPVAYQRKLEGRRERDRLRRDAEARGEVWVPRRRRKARLKVEAFPDLVPCVTGGDR